MVVLVIETCLYSDEVKPETSRNSAPPPAEIISTVVQLPVMDDSEDFFTSVAVTTPDEITLTTDDFDHLFVESGDMYVTFITVSLAKPHAQSA